MDTQPSDWRDAVQTQLNIDSAYAFAHLRDDLPRRTGGDIRSELGHFSRRLVLRAQLAQNLNPSAYEAMYDALNAAATWGGIHHLAPDALGVRPLVELLEDPSLNVDVVSLLLQAAEQVRARGEELRSG